MADFFTWTAAELGLGVQEMDKEHQVLIAKMNALHSGYEQKLPASKLQALLADLAQYTVKHFSDEETHMEKIKFSGLAAHKVIHQRLLAQFNDYVVEFQKTNTVNPALFNFLKVWLSGHIRGIDMRYADFGRTKKTA